jgi:hypothetical protein
LGGDIVSDDDGLRCLGGDIVSDDDGLRCGERRGWMTHAQTRAFSWLGLLLFLPSLAAGKGGDG